MKPLAFEMGGRNQNTQLLRRGWVPDVEITVLPDSASEALDACFPSALLPNPPSLADFSAAGVFDPGAASKGLVVDLGVLAEPKAAKAPEPRPNALVALPVGDDTPPGVGRVLKGLDLPCDELSPPNRLGNWAPRAEELSPWPPEPGVERESLLELLQDGRRSISK